MRILIFLFLFGVLGCGGKGMEYSPAISKEVSNSYGQDSISPGEKASFSTRPDDRNNEGESDFAQSSRKIIYNTEIDLIVEDFTPVEPELLQLINQFDGFIADARVNQYTGNKRSGTWTARIPVVKYRPFLAAVKELGTAVKSNEKAQDVTAEFVDLESRISNKKKLESRIIDLLDKTRDDLQQVIKVENELARVREQIEVMQGRLRMLDDVTSLTTVTVKITEQKTFVATPPPVVTFGGRIQEAWKTAVTDARQFFENVVVWLVRYGIALIAWFVIGTLVYFVVRIALKKATTAERQLNLEQ